MGQKVNPKGFRLAVRRNWDSRWYADSRSYPALLEEDYRIRKVLSKKFRYAAVPVIIIERAGNRVRVKVYTARPGMIIGRKGQELDKLKEDIQKMTSKEVLLDIQEVKKPDLIAQLVSENVALQLERRVPFRRAMKKAVQTAMSLGAEGISLQCAGRLGGAEIARTEAQMEGRMTRHTLRENVDYGFSEAQTLYGKIGIKCWILRKPEDQEIF